jgi:hypothetical protein
MIFGALKILRKFVIRKRKIAFSPEDIIKKNANNFQ